MSEDVNEYKWNDICDGPIPKGKVVTGCLTNWIRVGIYPREDEFNENYDLFASSYKKIHFFRGYFNLTKLEVLEKINGLAKLRENDIVI